MLCGFLYVNCANLADCHLGLVYDFVTKENAKQNCAGLVLLPPW